MTQTLAGKRVLLGVTGGIASYKAVTIARQLTQAGAEVDVVMTHGAQEFVGTVTFEGVTGRPVHAAMFEPRHALDHIRLPRAAQLIVVAPATADFLARAAAGRADDLLSACLLAADCPVMLAPAMNDRMWAHPQTMRNAEHLRELGYTVLEPATGPLAVGEGSGPGRMPEPESVVAHVERALCRRPALERRRIVVSAGATREPLDPVRFISNHSSGKMGVALARSAWRAGAEVTLIAAHMDVAPPEGVNLVAAPTASDMLREVRAALATADALIMAAAPADYAAAVAPAAQKIRRRGSPIQIELAPTEDILKATRDDRRRGAVIVGFALETGPDEESAARKLREKGLDLIVLNDACEEGAGFGGETNRVTLLASDGTREALPLLPKAQVADLIIARVEARLGGR